MARAQSAQEVRQEYVDSLGADLGSVFYALRNEVLWLHWRWSEYKVLFGGGHQRLKLLNDAATPFFRLVQNEFVRATLLHLCRLTDPPGRNRQKRLTLQRLPRLITKPDVAKTAKALVDEAVAKTDFARDLRNRAIAHTDLTFALDEGGTAFPIHRNDVDDAIAAVCAVPDHVSRQLMDQEMIFDVIAPPGAEALLYVIRDGLEAEEQRKVRIKEGRANAEDYQRARPLP